MHTDALVITGEFTIYHAAALKPGILEQVRQADAPALDLGAVTEMDGAGLQLLLFARREAAALGKRVRLAAVSAPVEDALRVAGLGTHVFDPEAA